jgi:asparagine synthase (glutamine-hydrolysing)
MCGVGGIVGPREPARETLERMAAVMAHRGPDGDGFWSGAGAGLAFRRLAIIDLHERSNQPMTLGPWRLVFNGEIYNYVELREELRARGREFVTEGDAEVLLHAWDEWGEDALDRLNGMFAFGIWHEEERRLTLASDPFGEKPLYWWAGGGELVFASDIPAILAARPELGEPRPEALGPFLAGGAMPPIDESFFAGIQRLPGAHVLRWREGKTEIARYWEPREVEVPATFGDAAAELRELLLDSVRLRLRSDVPVGSSLSGGVDSSAIVGLSAQLAGDHMRHAFTARFPGFARDEWAYAHEAAAAADVVEHHAVEPTMDGVIRDLAEVVRDQQEPFGSLSIYASWRVMRAARDAGVVVLLDGQGADELFGGYPGLGGWALRSLPAVATIRELAAGGYEPYDVVLATCAGRVPRVLRRLHRLHRMSPYAARDVTSGAAGLEPPMPPAATGRNALTFELLRQTFHTSLPELLRYADRNSMAASREVRLPFLDRRIAEFALSLPPRFLFSGGVTKRVLREAVRGIVPEQLLERRDKIGYEPPQATWLSSPAGINLAREVLLDGRARARGFYDVAAVEADARAGRWRDQRALWFAISLELWLDACARSSTQTPAVAA